MKYQVIVKTEFEADSLEEAVAINEAANMLWEGPTTVDVRPVENEQVLIGTIWTPKEEA